MRTEIKPQPGYQEIALSSPADIVIGGGAAGAGKTFSLLLDPLRHISVKGFGGVIFRRTSPQIRNEGGLWDTSMQLYPICNAAPRETSLDWQFPSGVKLSFRHLEYEKNKLDWQGAQIPFIGFDELTHFSKATFFYLLSRNRSVCGVKPYCRATCNPDPDSWVYEMIKWWIDPDTGYLIPERNGVVRFMLIDGENYIWGDTVEECIEKGWYMLEDAVNKSGIDPKEFVKSVTFVGGDIYGNRKLLEVNPSYLANLMAQDNDTKSALLGACWKAGVDENDVYDYAAFKGCFDNLKSVSDKGEFITADIAMKGSNKLVVCYWKGRMLMDVEIMDKSDGKQVIDLISSVAEYYGVQNRFVCYDSDGVGSYVDGFIKGAVPFNGGLPVIELKDPVSNKLIKENYFNLKTQCYYRSGNAVARGEIRISEACANKMYDDTMTVRQRFMFERKAIKRDKVDMDGKLRIIGKDQMKVKLNGQSPDLMDAFMMREMFELKPAKTFIG